MVPEDHPDRANLTKEGPLLWLDKAYIDQTAIDENLASLPIFLAGCKQLLVLAGGTYASRLWYVLRARLPSARLPRHAPSPLSPAPAHRCVVELFTFLRMGGSRDDVAVRLLDTNEAQMRLLAKFDAGKAKCFLPQDRERLLAVIEAGFGSFVPFNRIVRGIFADKLARHGAGDAERVRV